MQRQTTEQQKAQLLVAQAQIANARANLKTVSDTLAKQERSFAMDPQSVSQDTLDTARNAVAVAKTNLESRSPRTMRWPRRRRPPKRCWPNTPSARRKTAW